MIDKIVYTNERGDSVTLSHYAPFFLSNPEGFEGMNTDPSTSNSLYREGVNFHRNVLRERILTLNCHMYCEDEFERERLKRELYKAFNHTCKGSMKIYTEATAKVASELRVVQTPTFKWNYETENKLVEFQVQVMMPIPYFEETSLIRVDLGGDIGNFFFDFEIPITGREMSYRSDSLMTNLINDGDVNTPLRIILKAKNPVVNPKILNPYTKEYIEITKEMKKGEEITITTHLGNKRITSNIDGNLFNYLKIGSKFIWLNVGDNLIRYSAESGEENLSLEIYYTPYYLGV